MAPYCRRYRAAAVHASSAQRERDLFDTGHKQHGPHERLRRQVVPGGGLHWSSAVAILVGDQ